MNNLYINRFSSNKFKFNLNFKKIRLNEKNLNKLSIERFIPIVFDYEHVIIDNNKMSVKDFKKRLYSSKNNYVCFYNEQSKLSSFKVKSLYEIFPYITDKILELEKKPYEYTLEEQYNILIDKWNLLISITDFNFKYKTLPHQYNNFFKYKIRKKIKYKSLLDNNFFFSIKPHFSTVNTVVEKRKDRLIYLLDVNSMYPYATTFNNYTNPIQMRYYKKVNVSDILNKKITNGIFNVTLTVGNISNKEKEFIKQLPINKYEKNHSIPIDIFKYNSITMLLHANEIVFYSKYLDIDIIDGIYSEKSIHHPLKNISKNYYERRVNSNNDLEKKYLKYILAMGASASNNAYFNKIEIPNEIVDDYIKENFQYENSDSSYFDRYFKSIPKDKDFTLLETISINDHNIYSLFSQMLANSRITMMELYEKIYFSDSSFDLCYMNVDSLHISIPENKKEYFLESIKHEIGNEIGKLKIDAIGNGAVWFEPGRYWIYKDNELIDYKNIIFNNNSNDYDTYFFKDYLLVNGVVEEKIYYMFNNMSHKKIINKIDNNFYKFDYSENINTNMIHNYDIYKELFFKYIKKY